MRRPRDSREGPVSPRLRASIPVSPRKKMDAVSASPLLPRRPAGRTPLRFIDALPLEFMALHQPPPPLTGAPPPSASYTSAMAPRADDGDCSNSAFLTRSVDEGGNWPILG